MRRIMARQGRLCDTTHDCLLLMFRSCSPPVWRSPLKARRLQITGAPTPSALMSRRKIMISLSPPIKPTAHACFPVGTRSSEKLSDRPRDVNTPRFSVLFVPRFSLAHILPRARHTSGVLRIVSHYMLLVTIHETSQSCVIFF